MYKVYVALYNSHGCELSREKCEDMAAASQVVVDMCADCTLEVGDKIAFEEIEV